MALKEAVMQAKDIPVEPLLRFLAGLDWAAGWHDLQPRAKFCPTVLDAMPPGTPQKVALAKMRALLRAGLVDGCGCGCRGDFTITAKGRERISG